MEGYGAQLEIAGDYKLAFLNAVSVKKDAVERIFVGEKKPTWCDPASFGVSFRDGFLGNMDVIGGLASDGESGGIDLELEAPAIREVAPE